MLCSLHRNRGLIKALSKREILNRYRGSILGLLWTLINPLILLSVYTFVFSEIFKSQWGKGNGNKIEAALFIFIGLAIFNILSECINRSPRLILSNTNYVKRIVFPLEILPIASMMSSLFQATISFITWLAVYAMILGSPSLATLYLPLIVLPLILSLMGLSWALAALGVYLRDINQMVGVAITALMFLSPIFYPANHFPATYRHWLYFNPMTLVIEQARDALMWGKAPDLLVLTMENAAALLIAWLGFYWFQKVREGFADVV